MARTKRCDQCGKVEDEEAAALWLEVGSRFHFIHEPGEYHFCTWDCLRQYAIAKTQPNVAQTA